MESTDVILQRLNEQRLCRSLPRGHWWISEALLSAYLTGVFVPTIPDSSSDMLIGRVDALSQYLAYLNEILVPLDAYSNEGQPIELGSVVQLDGKTIFLRLYDSITRLFVLGYIDFQPYPAPKHPPWMLFGHGAYIQDLMKLTELRDCVKKHRWGNRFAPIANPPSFESFIQSADITTDTEHPVCTYSYDRELLNQTVEITRQNILQTA